MQKIVLQRGYVHVMPMIWYGYDALRQRIRG